jgi:hypothetical protein
MKDTQPEGKGSLADPADAGGMIAARHVPPQIPVFGAAVRTHSAGSV